MLIFFDKKRVKLLSKIS